jgi:hypothetical protein
MIGFVSCCLNCPLSDYIYKVLFGALTIGGGFIRFREFIQYLPIPRVGLSTLQEDREKALQQIIRQYGSALGNPKQVDSVIPFSELVSAIGDPGESRAPRDIVCFFLAYLAEEMIDLNKSKQVEVKRFLSWLEEELGITPDDSDQVGIHALVGKSLLRGYAGDYKRTDKNFSFEGLWKVLLKNTNRVERRLDRTFENKVREKHEKSLSVLQPIKHRLAATDWLIDQLVYRLYGLTEEEIAIVEGKGGTEPGS